MATRIATIVALSGLLIMLVLGVLMPRMSVLVAVIDAALLVAISTPLIYLSVIKPFVEAQDEALAQINHLAFTDPLTQLANRRLLTEHLDKQIASSTRHKVHGALLLIDLDGFKAVNDTYGHEAGDALLVEIATRIKGITRAEDIIARLGGDEFVVLINHLGDDEEHAGSKAMRVASKIFEAVIKPFEHNGNSLRVSASIGVRLLGAGDADTESAIREADCAMYRAKRKDEGSIVFSGDTPEVQPVVIKNPIKA